MFAYLQLLLESCRFYYSITSYNAGSGDGYGSNSHDDDGDGSIDEANEGDAANTDFSILHSAGY